MNALSRLQDLFFTFPLNNFLHNVVYDIFQQVLTGRLDQGLNRELVIVLFRDAHLIEKILHGQRLNDSMRYVRAHTLGYPSIRPADPDPAMPVSTSPASDSATWVI